MPQNEILGSTFVKGLRKESREVRDVIRPVRGVYKDKQFILGYDLTKLPVNDQRRLLSEAIAQTDKKKEIEIGFGYGDSYNFGEPGFLSIRVDKMNSPREILTMSSATNTGLSLWFGLDFNSLDFNGEIDRIFTVAPYPVVSFEPENNDPRILAENAMQYLKSGGVFFLLANPIWNVTVPYRKTPDDYGISNQDLVDKFREKFGSDERYIMEEPFTIESAPDRYRQIPWIAEPNSSFYANKPEARGKTLVLAILKR